MDKEIRLLSLSGEEVVIAEKVVAHNRKYLPRAIEAAQEAILYHQSGRDELSTTRKVLAYRLSLYKALLEQFDRDYPLIPEQQPTGLKTATTAPHEGKTI